jgi:hypothetical protein
VRREEGEFRSLTPSSSAGGPESSRRGERGNARVEEETLELGPRSLGEVLDLALEIFRSRFGIFVGLSTLLWIPVRLAQPFIGLHTWAHNGTTDPSIGFLFSFLFSNLSTWVVAALVNAFAAILVAARFGSRVLPVTEALRAALARAFPLLAITFLSGILTTAGWACVCLLCAPGVYLAYKLCLAPVVCVVEGAGIAESLSRSFELMRDRFLPWVGMATVTLFLTLPLSSIGAVTDDPNLRDLLLRELGISGSLFDWAAVPFTALFLGVATAFHGVVGAVWYFDCRARREGVDLAARLERSSALVPAAGIAS